MDNSASVATASSARRAVLRIATMAPQDSLFITLLNGFRSSGGRQRLPVLQATRRDAWSADVIEALPARVTDRNVLAITRNDEAWVPDFQFAGHGATKQPAAAVFLELTPSHDPWELATWFVTPSNRCMGRVGEEQRLVPRAIEPFGEREPIVRRSVGAVPAGKVPPPHNILRNSNGNRRRQLCGNTS